MGVNSLPKTVARQRRDCNLNPGPYALESITLTTRLPKSLYGDRNRQALPSGERIRNVVLSAIGLTNQSMLTVVPRLSTRRYPHLLLSAGACSYQSISPAPAEGAQQQTSCTPLLLSIGGLDIRTDTRPLHRPCSAYY